MKVCFIDRKGAHSIWRLINSIAGEVISQGAQVEYLRLDDPTQRTPIASPRKVEIHDISVVPKRFPWDVIKQEKQFRNRLREHFERGRPDLLHTNFCVPGSTARQVAKQDFDIPVVTTCHELFGSMNAYLRRRVRRTKEFADRSVYISETVARSYGSSISASTPCQGNVERIIYNGVEVDRIIETASNVVDLDPTRIVTVGRMVPEKGHRQVIDALPQLLKQIPDVCFELIGDGPERPKLEALVRSRGLNPRVKFLGWLDHAQVIERMGSAGVIVMPSHPVQEGFGLALVEAMCCGRPIVATDIPVFREVAGEKSPILFFRDNDPGDLADQLRAALIDVREARGNTTPDDYGSHRFSSSRMAAEYVRLYEELMT